MTWFWIFVKQKVIYFKIISILLPVRRPFYRKYFEPKNRAPWLISQLLGHSFSETSQFHTSFSGSSHLEVFCSIWRLLPFFDIIISLAADKNQISVSEFLPKIPLFKMCKLDSLTFEVLCITCMFCAIWYHLYNLKNVKSTSGGVLLFVNFQAFGLQFY